jgi:hypothetical protein
MKRLTPTCFQFAAIAASLASGLGCSPTAVLTMQEAESGPTIEVLDPKGRFRSALSFPFTLGETDAGDFHLEIALEGSSVEMNCFILDYETQIGVSSLRIAQTIFDNFEENDFNLSARRILNIGAGAIGDTAYQSLSISFNLHDAEGNGGLGMMKTASANKQGHAIACNHWDAGYLETFARVFAELVRNFEPSDPLPAPFYVEVSQIRVNDLLVGVASTRLVRDGEGDIQIVEEGSSLIPRSELELQATHSKSIDWARSDGTLINAYQIESDVDGEVTNLALNWHEEIGWKIAGTFGRKELAQELGHEHALASSLSEALALRYELRPHGERSQVIHQRWIPSVDPSRATEVKITVDEENATFATIALGPIEIRAQRSENGLPERFTWSLGSIDMAVDRIYQRGDL